MNTTTIKTHTIVIYEGEECDATIVASLNSELCQSFISIDLTQKREIRIIAKNLPYNNALAILSQINVDGLSLQAIQLILQKGQIVPNKCQESQAIEVIFHKDSDDNKKSILEVRRDDSTLEKISFDSNNALDIGTHMVGLLSDYGRPLVFNE